MEQYGERLKALERYPEDAAVALIEPLDFLKMGLSWELPSGGAHDSSCILDDWAKPDEFIEKMPDPENDPQFEDVLRLAEQSRKEDRYLLFGWWLHSCGNNTALLDDLIEAGVQVFYPVQKGTMDELAVSQKYGDRLTFLAGIDVQHTLQEKPPEGVRQEVRFLIETFDRLDGGMCIAAGNGIVSGTPYACIEICPTIACNNRNPHTLDIRFARLH